MTPREAQRLADKDCTRCGGDGRVRTNGARPNTMTCRCARERQRKQAADAGRERRLARRAAALREARARLKRLRESLPATTEHLVDGRRWAATEAGNKRLMRDLAALGARRTRDGTWCLPGQKPPGPPRLEVRGERVVSTPDRPWVRGRADGSWLGTFRPQTQRVVETTPRARATGGAS